MVNTRIVKIYLLFIGTTVLPNTHEKMHQTIIKKTFVIKTDYH